MQERNSFNRFQSWLCRLSRFGNRDFIGEKLDRVRDARGVLTSRFVLGRVGERPWLSLRVRLLGIVERAGACSVPRVGYTRAVALESTACGQMLMLQREQRCCTFQDHARETSDVDTTPRAESRFEHSNRSDSFVGYLSAHPDPRYAPDS